MYDVAVRVSHHLNLDMSGIFDVSLDVYRRVVECKQRLLFRSGKRGRKFIGGSNDSHASSAAARRCLDDDRITHLGGNARCFLFILDETFEAGSDWDAGRLHRPASLSLVAHEPDSFGLRPYKSDVARLANLGEVRVLRQESVAWMYGIDVGHFGRRYHRRDIKVAFGRWRRADADRFIGESYVQRVAIRLGVDGDGANSKLLAGPDHSSRDLASVSN